MSDTKTLPGQMLLVLDEVLRAEREALGVGRDGTAPTSALCIFGGGIRSATFGLGAIQGLAEHGLLGRFDYLSTVSGGGYVGGWLSAWVNRAKGIANVIPRLRQGAPPPKSGEPDPVQHLRDYNSYLTPKSGAFSSDVWTLVATVLRNILLNWIVLVPLLMAALMVPKLYLSALAFPELLYGKVIFAADSVPNYSAHELDVIGQSPWVKYLIPLLSIALFATALVNTLRGGLDTRRPGHPRFWGETWVSGAPRRSQVSGAPGAPSIAARPSSRRLISSGRLTPSGTVLWSAASASDSNCCTSALSCASIFSACPYESALCRDALV